MYRGAMCAILSELNRQDRLKVVETFDIDDAQDQDLVAALDELGLAKRPLIVTETGSEELYLAARNIPLRGGPRRAGPGPGRRWSAPSTW